MPHGLLARLQPLTFEGTTRFALNVQLDMADLQKTVIELDLPLQNLSVQSLSGSIGFGALTSSFQTHFEMPDGRVLTRETGPEGERWVSMDRIHPLVPASILCQEVFVCVAMSFVIQVIKGFSIHTLLLWCSEQFCKLVLFKIFHNQFHVLAAVFGHNQYGVVGFDQVLKR